MATNLSRKTKENKLSALGEAGEDGGVDWGDGEGTGHHKTWPCRLQRETDRREVQEGISKHTHGSSPAARDAMDATMPADGDPTVRLDTVQLSTVTGCIMMVLGLDDVGLGAGSASSTRQ